MSSPRLPTESPNERMTGVTVPEEDYSIKASSLINDASSKFSISIDLSEIALRLFT